MLFVLGWCCIFFWIDPRLMDFEPRAESSIIFKASTTIAVDDNMSLSLGRKYNRFLDDWELAIPKSQCALSINNYRTS